MFVAIDVRSAASSYLLRRGRQVKLIREERKMKHFGGRLVERDETIFSMENSLERYMNQPKQIVQIVGRIHAVDYFEIHLTFQLRPLFACNVLDGPFVARYFAPRVPDRARVF